MLWWNRLLAWFGRKPAVKMVQIAEEAAMPAGVAELRDAIVQLLEVAPTDRDDTSMSWRCCKPFMRVTLHAYDNNGEGIGPTTVSVWVYENNDEVLNRKIETKYVPGLRAAFIANEKRPNTAGIAVIRAVAKKVAEDRKASTSAEVDDG